MFLTSKCQSSRLRYLDLEKQIWREISTVSDFRLLKERIRKKASAEGEPLKADFADQKVNDIQYCIKQAFEYFNSSKHASVLIKPTLIYYGLINIAAAIVILRKRDKALHTMKEAHGLKDIYPDKLKSTDINSIGREDILKIGAEIQESGTFVELLDIDVLNYFTLPIKRVNHTDTSQDFSQTTNFSKQYPTIKQVDLLTLFQNIPEIWKECRLSLKAESYVFMGEPVAQKDIITYRISKEHITIDELRNNFSFISKSEGPHESNDYYFFNLSKKNYDNLSPLVKTDIIGNQYITSDLNNPLVTNDFTLYYLTFFILGSLSRYKPALWRLMVDNSMKGLNTIPEVLCDSAYIKLPMYLLMELDSKFYKL